MNLARAVRPSFSIASVVRTGRLSQLLRHAYRGPRVTPTITARTQAPRFYSGQATQRETESQKAQKKAEEESDLTDAEKEVDSDLADAEPEKKAVPHISAAVLKEKDEQIKLLEQTLHDLQQNYKQAQIDQENMKKILHRDLSKAEDVGVDKLAKKLFPVSDTLILCLKHEPNWNDAENKDNVEAKTAWDGLRESKTKFDAVLSNFKITEVNPALGSPFDPNQHDALFELEAPPGSNLAPGTIGAILKAGWIHNEILLRPVTVGVIKKS